MGCATDHCCGKWAPFSYRWDDLWLYPTGKAVASLRWLSLPWVSDTGNGEWWLLFLFETKELAATRHNKNPTSQETVDLVYVQRHACAHPPLFILLQHSSGATTLQAEERREHIVSVVSDVPAWGNTCCSAAAEASGDTETLFSYSGQLWCK